MLVSNLAYSPLSHRLRNLLHSAVLLLGMAGLAWGCATLIWGAATGLLVLIGVFLGMLVAPRLPADFILRLYRAQALTATDFPDGVRMLHTLSARAELPKPPRFFYVPSALPNAFSVGSRDDAAVAVSDGLLRLLNPRELQGVLAHEISHVANRDLWIMGLADIMSRITGVTSYMGQFLLFLNLPLWIMGHAPVPWLVVFALILSPTIMSLLQLALSRAREYSADLDAATLTGDPLGLAAALVKLERSNGRFWEEILLPGRRIPEPSVLRTHPPTSERVRRLRELAQSLPDRDHDSGHGPMSHSRAPVPHRPRWHRTGVWY